MSADEAVEEKSRRRRKGGSEEDATDEEERGVTTRKGRATRSRRRGEVEEGGNFIVRSFQGIRDYFKGVSDELDKVVWPSREDTIRLSGIVIAVTAASAVVLGMISFFYSELFIQGIREDNPIVFVIFGVAVVLALWAYNRFYAGQDDINPPY